MNAKQELTDLTIFRAVFAAWVFAYHVDLYLNFSKYLGPCAEFIRRGYLGVDGFFLLSGLILAHVHPELGGAALNEVRPDFQPPSLAAALNFWGKRLARIYPVHVATILILVALIGLGTYLGWAPRDSARFDWPSLLQNLFLVQGWGGTYQGAWNYPSWSVSTEWAGYLLFPIMWYLLAYFGAFVSFQVAVAMFTILGFIFVVNGDSLNLTFTDGLLRFFPEFIIGMATARFVHIPADLVLVRRIALFGGLLILLVSTLLAFDLTVVLGLWLLLLAFLMQADTGLSALLGKRPRLNRLGRLSYAFYMSFSIAELLLAQGFRRAGWQPAGHELIFAAGMLGLTFAIAIVLHASVETPCRRIVDRWLASRAES